MPKYEKIAEDAWLLIQKKVQELDQAGVKRAKIARMLGHKGRSAVTNWLKGDSTAQKTDFATMLRYLEVLNIDVRQFFPGLLNTENCAQLQAEVEILRRENLDLKEQLLKTTARAEAFESLLAKQLKPSDVPVEKKSV